MCLYPKLIKNRRYIPNKRNGGVPPICDDYRKLYVPVGCGVCIECMKQKALQWKIRLNEEIKVNKYAYYVTFSFSPLALKELLDEHKMKTDCNAIAGIAIRRYLERWRKKYKKSQRHFFITELGQDYTERIHLHGIIFSNFAIPSTEFETIWKYGNVRIGEYCNLKTINYIAKYLTKIDKIHKNYRPEIFCSSGIGKTYIQRTFTREIHTFSGKKTVEYYKFQNGKKANLPIYYRNHLFSEDEREKLWIQKLEQCKRYVMGIEIENTDTIQGEERYFKVLKKAQEKNAELGYGDSTKEWQKKTYNVTRKMLMKGTQKEK